MVAFPFCKINLGLQILSKRPDGYHDIATCFYPLPWTDILEVISSRSLAFSQTGIVIPGNPEDNLCVKAFNLLKRDFRIRAAKIHLHKIIPAGAGLGGGSSDAAHTLTLINSVFKLGLSDDALKNYALELGSDCPFFVQTKPAIGRGRGDKLEPVALDLKGMYVVLITPGVHVSTAEAYAGVAPQLPPADIATIIQKPINTWKLLLKNDFEPSVFAKHPVLAEIKDKLYRKGALYASMSGSGSSVFGIFEKEMTISEHFKEMQGWSGWL